MDHTDTLFAQHVQNYEEEICPEDGVISYKDGEVLFSIHSDDDGGDVPFLK